MQHIIVLGFQSPLNLINLLAGNSHPTILQQYSYRKYDGNLAQDLAHWLMPKDVCAYDQTFQLEYTLKNGRLNASRIVDRREPECKHFVLTSSSNRFLFGTSQLFYDKQPACIPHDNKNFLCTNFQVPKIIIVLSNVPQLKMHQQLIDIFNKVHNGAIKVTIPTERSFYDEKRISGIQNPQKSQRIHRVICFSSQFIWAFYLSIAAHVSTSVWKTEKISWDPLSGLPPISFAPYTTSLYTMNAMHFSFNLYLSNNNLIRFVSCLLQEKQIIVMSNNINRCVYFLQTIRHILRPLQWQFLYVPHLTESLFDAMHSFMPYVVGVQKLHEQNIIQEYCTSEHVIVDLDRDVVRMNHPVMPTEASKWLTKCFDELLSSTQKQLKIKKNCLKMLLVLIGDILVFFHKNGRGNICYNQEEHLKSISKSSEAFYSQFFGKTMIFRKLIEDIENLLNNNKTSENPIMREFLHLVIVAKNNCDDVGLQEVSTFIDAKFKEAESKMTKWLTISTEKTLLNHYNLHNGKALVPFKPLGNVYSQNSREEGQLKSMGSQKSLNEGLNKSVIKYPQTLRKYTGY